MLIFDAKGSPVPMGEKLGGGDEAEIRAVAEQPESAAKLYRNPSRRRAMKLHAMIDSPPGEPAGDVEICWPQSQLFSKTGSCEGFLMARRDVSGQAPVSRLHNPLERQHVSLDITWKHLIRAAINITAAVEAIHAAGHVVGDFKENNILVAPDGRITITGCDSMQVRDPEETWFRCATGKPELTPPELQGCEFKETDRSAAHDNFGLAVLLFQLLMEGTHPFSGIWKKKKNVTVPMEARIRNGLCPYAGNAEMNAMPSAPPFNLFPPSVADLFIKCFREGHSDPSLRPSAAEWKEALTQLDQNLAQCPIGSRHVYSRHLPSCPWCRRKAALGGIDPFPSEIQKLFPAAQDAGHNAVADNLRVNAAAGSFRRRIRLAVRAAAALILTLTAVMAWSRSLEPARHLWAFLAEDPVLSAVKEELFASAKPRIELPVKEQVPRNDAAVRTKSDKPAKSRKNIGHAVPTQETRPDPPPVEEVAAVQDLPPVQEVAENHLIPYTDNRPAEIPPSFLTPEK